MQNASHSHAILQDHIVVQDEHHERDAGLVYWIPSPLDHVQVRRHGVGQVWQGSLARLLYLEQRGPVRSHREYHMEVWIPEVPKGPVGEEV